MKNISTFIAIVLLVFVGYKLFKRYVFVPSMDFKSEPFRTIDGNDTLSIDGLKGKVVIVSCYQTWCVDCARETPELNQLATNLNTSKFTVLYISDEEAGKVNRFRQRFTSDKIVFVQTSRSPKELGISVFPTTFLVNAKGEVIKTKKEGYHWLQEEGAIKKMLAEIP